MKKLLIVLLSLAVIVVSIVACGKNDDAGNSQGNTETSTNTNTNTSTETNTNTNTATDTNVNTGSESDTNTDTSTDTGVEIVPPVTEYDSEKVEESLKDDLTVFDSEDEFGVGGTMSDYITVTTVDVSKVASNARYTINEGGTYRITGTSSDGQIFIQAPDQEVILVLDNVSLTSKSFANPAIYAEDCSKVSIIIVGDNYLADNDTNDGEGAVIRVRSCNLTIDGKGTLNITAKAKHGISNTKEITINGGNFNITAPNQGIYGKLGLIVNAGRFNIEAGKSGLKSGDVEDLAVGNMQIKSGSFTLNVGSNGLNCNGTLSIFNGRIVINSASGNGIDAADNVTISSGVLIIDSYKSAITTNANVVVSGSTNLKIETKGNGISANDVKITTNGVVFIKTAPKYELATADTPADETKYVYVDNEYIVYDSNVHPASYTKYVLKDCHGIEADGTLTVSNGTIGVDSYQDAFNANNVEIAGGKLVFATTKDAIDGASSVTISSAIIDVLASEKGIKSTNVQIDSGTISIITATDSIKAEKTTINGGRIYLFDKIDSGKTGTVTINNGTVLMITTTDNPQTTVGAAQYHSKLVENKAYGTAGMWIEIECGSEKILLQLTKDYSEKMTVYFTTSDLASEMTISLGTNDETNGFEAITKE